MGISPDGACMVLLDSEKSLRIFNLPQGELVQTLLEPVVGWAFSTTGQQSGRLFTSSSYGTVRSWRIGTNEPGVSLPGRVNTNLLLVDPAGSWLACSDRSKVRIWHLPDPADSSVLDGHSFLITALAASPDGKILVSGADDHTIRLWQMPECVPLPGRHVLEGLSGGVRALSYIPGAGSGIPDHIAGSDDSLIHVWAVDNLAGFLHELPGSLDLAELHRWENWKSNLEPGGAESKWLDYGVDLAHWQHRFDIDLQEMVQTVTIGQYDIEIEAVKEDS